MAEVLLKAENLKKSFGGVMATDNLSLSVETGTIHAVIGPNGAGKTTLIAQLAGALKPDGGRILLGSEDISALAPPARSRRGISRTFQITSIFHEFTALENVALAVQAAGAATRAQDALRSARRVVAATAASVAARATEHQRMVAANVGALNLATDAHEAASSVLDAAKSVLSEARDADLGTAATATAATATTLQPAKQRAGWPLL